MRSLVGLFGALCGVIVVALVARYGFKTSDNEIDGLINAFLFGTIAIGGLGGHAVAVRIWRLNRLWSTVLWIVCASALVVNLSNSLGAIAGRSERTLAERAKASGSVADDHAELKRVIAQRAEIPQFRPTDGEAVKAAATVLETAKATRESECKDGRGARCRLREADEAARTAELAAATAAKASTELAAKLDQEIATVRARLDKAAPVQDPNPQGAALARLFSLPQAEADRASTIQQFAIAVIVELLIAGAFIAFEIMGREHKNVASRRDSVETLETEDVLEPPISRARIAPPETPKPRLVSSDVTAAGSVPEIMADALEIAHGERVEIEEAYQAYAAACASMGKRAVKPEHFVELLKKFCKVCRIKTGRSNDLVYLLNVRLVVSETDVATG